MAASSEPQRRAYKIVSCDGRKRFGIVCSTLCELREKGCQKLGIECLPSVRTVLESDATLVDDEEYFSSLEAQTAFVFDTEEDKYIPLCMKDHIDGYGLDETDSAISWISDDSHLDELIMALRSDLSTLVTFSPDDLQLLVDCGTGQLSSYLDSKHGPHTAERVQSACQRFLDEYQQAKECASLLDLLGSQTNSKSSIDHPSGDP